MTLNRQNRSRPVLTRRQLLSRAGAIGAAGLTLPAALSSGVLADTARGSSPRTLPNRRVSSGDGGELYFANWPAYIDPTEDDLVGTVDRFIEATGIDMTYTEEINDNNEYFAVIQPVLGRGDRIDADIMALTGWMAGRLINLEWVDELPLDDIPNAANLRDDLVNPAWDPEGRFSLPWQTGLGGIAYNLEATGRELTSTNDLFDPEFNGRIGMLLEMNDTLGLVLLSLGVDISTISSFSEAEDAFAKLEQAKAEGQIRAFTGNDYLQDLESGNFAACVGWSGDVAQLSVDNPNIRFIIPEEGGHSWADTMLMPKGAEHRDEAARWMDFVYDPEQAAQITASVQFISPVKGVQEEVAKIDPELAENPLVFPNEEMLGNVYDFAYLDDETQTQFDEAWAALVGA
jgi:spermidine/putrescine transport system substrate-binding protein